MDNVFSKTFSFLILVGYLHIAKVSSKASVGQFTRTSEQCRRFLLNFMISFRIK